MGAREWKAAERLRKRASGLRPVEVWIPEEHEVVEVRTAKKVPRGTKKKAARGSL